MYLFQGIECNQEECVRLLLSHKVDLNQADRDKNTALHLAVKEGNTGMVAMLIKSGANINPKNKVMITELIESKTIKSYYMYWLVIQEIRASTKF